MSDPDVNIHLYRDEEKKRKETRFLLFKEAKRATLRLWIFSYFNKKIKKIKNSISAGQLLPLMIKEFFFCSSCNYSALKPFFRLWVRSVLCLRS